MSIDRIKYLETIPNLNSRDIARKALIHWDNHLEINNKKEDQFLQELKQLKQEPEFYQKLNFFVLHLINNVSPRTVRVYFSAIKQYLRFNGFRIYNEDIKQFIRFPKILRINRVPLDRRTIQVLLDNASNYMKLVILALVSSGMRANELLQLTYGDLQYPFVRVRAETTKLGVERKTFFSEQVWQFLFHLKNQAHNADYVFCSNYEYKRSLDELESKFGLLRNKTKLLQKYENSTLHIITIHRFRAYCKTMASNVCDKDFAEGLIGHEGYLGTYNALPEEMRLENYKKLEPKLTFIINVD